MKFKYILIVLSVLQFGACSDDKGNYIYKEINELMVVENLEKGKLYTKVSFVDSLSFDPVINSTLKDFNEADYEYLCMGHRTKRILRIERKEYQTY